MFVSVSRFPANPRAARESRSLKLSNIRLPFS